MIRLLTIAWLCTAVYGAAISVDRYNTSMDTILKAVGTLPCMRKCIDPLMNTFASVWEMKDIKKHTNTICEAYEKAADCLERDQFCDINKNFLKAASSLQHRCQTQVKLFEGFESCVNPYLDSIAQKCDNNCQGRQNFIKYSEKKDIQTISQLGGNSLIAVGHAKDLCDSLSCMLPCITDELNAVCPNSGWLALDTLMQPLEAISEGVKGLGPALKDLIITKIEKKCKFIVDGSIQKKIRKGDFSDLK